MVDLQKNEAFNELDVALISVATDPVSAWEEEAANNDISLPLVSDEGAKVCAKYDVMQWQMGGEPGHTFVLVDRDGKVAWVRDYGAPDNGGLMYVEPEELVPAVEKALG